MIAPRYVLIFLFLLAAALGCQKRDPSVALLEAENRWLEDQIYNMEDHIVWQDAQLESCRRENAALRDEINNETGTDTPGPRGGRPSDGTPGLPEIEIPGSSGQSDIEFGTPAVPEIDFGTPSGSGPEFGDPRAGDSSSTDRHRDTTQLTALKQGGGGSTATREEKAEPVGDANQVDQIVLNRRLTGGKNFDNVKGDEGIMVVVEPQDAEGRYLAAAAPVSVVLLDPYKSGKAAYVARWNFDTVDTAGLLRESAVGRGIYLNLPWPNQPPEHSQLKLYVRYATPDGRKLDVQQDIRVDIPPMVSRRQTPSKATAADVPQKRATKVAERPAKENPEQPKNPLRPKTAASSSTNRTFNTGDTAQRLPPNHNPDELPPLWNPDGAAGDDDEKSVVVRQDNPRPEAEGDQRIEQALRPRPWAPMR